MSSSFFFLSLFSLLIRTCFFSLSSHDSTGHISIRGHPIFSIASHCIH